MNDGVGRNEAVLRGLFVTALASFAGATAVVVHAYPGRSVLGMVASVFAMGTGLWVTALLIPGAYREWRAGLRREAGEAVGLAVGVLIWTVLITDLSLWWPWRLLIASVFAAAAAVACYVIGVAADSGGDDGGTCRGRES